MIRISFIISINNSNVIAKKNKSKTVIQGPYFAKIAAIWRGFNSKMKKFKKQKWRSKMKRET